ncbi:hypothetical protein [Rheinheimera texasensis]|uniref:hypothetical protein n=1 Tax=Rheinheimera texasensis TaxID=306205 RepID=UPI0004E0E35B|nr:hypothetical protein [Rheinheimera texasensis]
MLKRVPVLALLLWLTGCAHTQVHLYGRYLSAEQTEQLRSSLQAQGFAVTVNDLAFPAQVQQNTLITGLLMDRPAEADQLRNLLEQQGWSALRVESMVHGNHWYSGNAIGLFLLPPGQTVQQTASPKDFSYLYQGAGCAGPASIELLANQRFQIRIETSHNLDAAMLQGQWRIRQYPYLELQADADPNWFYYLEISQVQSADQISAISKIVLTPLQSYPAFAGCMFEYGVRQSQTTP